MSEQQPPPQHPVSLAGWRARPSHPTAWSGWIAEPSADRIPWRRYLTALRRYKWLIAVCVLVGLGLGFLVSRLLRPAYEVQATLWVTGGARDDRDGGPLRVPGLLSADAWSELLRSFTILDEVSRNERLYLHIDEPEDSALFRDFATTPAVRSGAYTLRVDGRGRYTLAGPPDDAVLERGAVGDSVGRRVGFLWRPDTALLEGERDLEFAVQTPRQGSMALRERLNVDMADTSFIKLTLRGPDPERDAQILNTLIRQFISVATGFKRFNHTELASQLEQQLAQADSTLRAAEIELERFRVNTITLPSEGSAVAGGVQATSDPVLTGYFDQKTRYDALRQDRAALERILADARAGSVNVAALMAIPAVAEAPELRAALDELATSEASLQRLRVRYTDEYKPVRDLVQTTERLKRETIPVLAAGVLERLQRQEGALDTRIRSASRQLRSIPPRMIEEARLEREVATQGELVGRLKTRYEEAKMAEAAAFPDVTVLDTAVAPLEPTSNTRPRILITALLASIAAAIAIALLLDQTDRRFRYPEQAAELGLPILGAVPNVSATSGGSSPEEAAQIVEAFRSLRLNLRQGYERDGPIIVTITSPGEGDGKSLISSNLALSFAEAGCRTLLVDGDTRRGSLHAMFGAPSRPGLIDHLTDDLPIDDVLHDVRHDNLTLLPCGARLREGPELLMSPKLGQLFEELRRRYDVVIVDSPPLGAGVDPYVLSAATQNVVLVLRTGRTDRNLAAAKLELFARLPVQVHGAVLNDIRAEGVYRHYSYLYTEPKPGVPRIAAPPVLAGTDGRG